MLVALALVGCGSKRPKLAPEEGKKKPDDGKIEAAETGAGSYTRYSETLPRRALWTVKWGSATLQYDQKGHSGGEMAGASGRLFTKTGAQASAFSASRAKSAFGSKRLELNGGVKLAMRDPVAVIQCQEAHYDPDVDRIEARGKVFIEAEGIRLGPFDALYASPDLKELSTPDLFRKTP